MKDQLEAQMNVVLNKPSQASNFINPYIPARAVDGSLNPVNRWLAHTVPNSLDVDLQTPYWIDRWVMKHMGVMGWSSPQYNMSDYELHVSSDKLNWIKVDSVIGNTLNVTDRNFEPVSARYVRVVVRRGLNCNPQLSSIGQLEVYEAQPTSAYLNKLDLSSGTLKPPFSPTNSTYTADVSYTTESIKVMPTAEDLEATIKVKGTVVQSGTASQPINLNVGSNTITVEVTSKVGGIVKNYSVNVTRQDASLIKVDVNYAGRGLNPGIVVININEGQPYYTANVPLNASIATITPYANSSEMTITVKDEHVPSGGTSSSISLGNALTIINIKTTSPIGRMKDYALNVQKGI